MTPDIITVESPSIVPKEQRNLIAFTGLAGSGKSTAAMFLVDTFGFRRMRFAGPLKDMMRALGLNEREIEGDLKEKPCDLLAGKTPRFAMQTIGTEWGRDMIAPDIWIRAFKSAIANVPLASPVVIDDCRFPNEAEAIKEVGGSIIKIVRLGAGAGAAGHTSEGQELPFDAELTNNSDMRTFFRRLEMFIVGRTALPIFN